ncbi:MAG: isoleucine--tRNA ligase [Chloroflexota bacterium]
MFHPVTSKVSFPQVEEKILELWKKRNIFAQSVERRRGSPRFNLYEGPPTANGNPGIHHVLSRVFKDVIPRYKAMKGFYTPRIAGWDTHGLPVELEIEKKLGFSGKAQIEAYGVEKFNQLCRQSVLRYLKDWEALTERIGFWIDLKNAYITMDNKYIETGWWAIKQMWDNGLVYQGYRVTPHCPRCGTSLSSHEVALGYQDDVEDPSVYIKFKLTEDSLKRLSLDKPSYLLAWTTTPWTLTSNTALAVAAAVEYAVVEVEDEYLIMAGVLLERVGLGGNKIAKRVEGKDLVGVGYEPLFNPHHFGVDRKRFTSRELVTQTPDQNLSYRVIATDFVSTEDGTGIVHIAPAYGEVDYQAGEANNLDFVHAVDLQGKLTGNYPFSGKFVKDADADVLNDLKSRGLLFRSEKIRHTYPFCWRCSAPLLYYAKQTWYIKTTSVKERLIAGNNEINWYPEHIKYGRFGDWLENNVDWAFSRERYWGTPLPVWRCENPKCGNQECAGSVEELKKKPGLVGMKEPLDLHRPFVDGLTYNCAKCGAKMARVPEVIDCWFDSGAMPMAQFHYPFENETLLKDGRFPADYICEAVDQTRGWFYSLHAISTLLFDRPSFKNVICLGLILDAEGEKMSKAKGNVVEPWAIVNKYGADILRWYFFTGAPAGNVRRFDEKALPEVTRRFFLTLWNVYSFFVTYANLDHFTPGAEGGNQAESELDRWIISELNQLIMDVDSALEHYDPTEAGRKLEDFVDSLSNWYVRRGRRRFWKSESDTDKLAAYNTLYSCLVTLAKLLAPLAPFLADELYQNLVLSAFPESPESVHLPDFPVANESRIDRQLVDDTRLAMKISSIGRASRSQAKIRVRQPLSSATVKVTSSREIEGLKRLQPQILDELNIKELEPTVNVGDIDKLDKNSYAICWDGDYAVGTATAASAELKAEGMAREIVHRLQTMRRSAGFDIADHITASYQSDDYIKNVMDTWRAYIEIETLSVLRDESPQEDAFKESYKLEGHEILLGVKKVG